MAMLNNQRVYLLITPSLQLQVSKKKGKNPHQFNSSSNLRELVPLTEACGARLKVFISTLWKQQTLCVCIYIYIYKNYMSYIIYKLYKAIYHIISYHIISYHIYIYVITIVLAGGTYPNGRNIFHCVFFSRGGLENASLQFLYAEN